MDAYTNVYWWPFSYWVPFTVFGAFVWRVPKIWPLSFFRNFQLFYHISFFLTFLHVLYNLFGASTEHLPLLITLGDVLSDTLTRRRSMVLVSISWTSRKIHTPEGNREKKLLSSFQIMEIRYFAQSPNRGLTDKNYCTRDELLILSVLWAPSSSVFKILDSLVLHIRIQRNVF